MTYKTKFTLAALCLNSASAIQLQSQDIFTDMGDWIVGAGEDIGDWTVGAVNDIGDWTTGAVNDIGSWTEGAVYDVGDWTIGAGEDIGTWTVGAANDIGKWTVNAAEDVEDWTVGAVNDIGDWFENAAHDIEDWSNGAVDDVSSWTINAGKDIRDWTVDATNEIGEFTSDLFDRMGSVGDDVIREINNAANSIEDWGEDTLESLGKFSMDVHDEIMKMEDHFQSLGQFAAELYKEAENAAEDVADEFKKLGDAMMAEAIKIGSEIEKAALQMEYWANSAIKELENAMYIVGRELENLSNTEAMQKTRAFLNAVVQETAKAAEHLYKSTEDIVNQIRDDGLHNVLADGIVHFGDAATHFATETFLNEVGGTVAQLVMIPVTTGMKAIGMEEEGQSMKKFVDDELKNMSECLDQVMTEQFDMYATLIRDPEQWVKDIEQKPWLLVNFALPFSTTGPQTFNVYSEAKIQEYFDVGYQDFSLPSGWITDL